MSPYEQYEYRLRISLSDSGRKLCGGLCLALFRKAQRLPCAKLNADAEGHDEEVNKALQSSLSSL